MGEKGEGMIVSCCSNAGFSANKKYKEKPEDTKFSALYFNDWHGKKDTLKLAGLASATDTFMKNNNDGFVLCAGDTLIGGRDGKKTIASNKFLVRYLNYLANITKKYSKKDNSFISAVGNHEFDAGEKNLAQALEKANFKIVATNLHLKDSSPLKQFENKIIFQSVVAEKNGHYYGFIGALPMDSRKRQPGMDFLPDMDIGRFDRKTLKIQKKYEKLRKQHSSDEKIKGFVNKQEEKLDRKLLKDTMKQLQKEVNELTGEGINKIIFISHLGLEKDKIVAKNTKGIDIIIGGHMHDKLDGVETEENLLLNLDKEPVILTQGGKDGDYFGTLNLLFDKKGVIKAETIQNKLQRTTKQPVDKKIEKDIQKLKEKYFGIPEVLGDIDRDFIPINPDIQENPIMNMLGDAVKQKIIKENKDIPEPELVFFNSSTARGGFKAPVITTEDIDNLLPFDNKPVVILLTEKNIYAALQHGVDTLKEKPELLQVSGIRYEVKDGKVTKAFFVDEKSGKESPIKPDSDKEHVIVTDSYLSKGGINFTMINVPEQKIVRTFNWTRQDAIKEYIKELSKNELQDKLKPQGRISFGSRNVLRFNNFYLLNKEAKYSKL